MNAAGGCGSSLAGAEMSRPAEVVVVPGELCGDGWSRKAIAPWNVYPRRPPSLNDKNLSKSLRNRGVARSLDFVRFGICQESHQGQIRRSPGFAQGY